jgi:hypothetical protein
VRQFKSEVNKLVFYTAFAERLNLGSADELRRLRRRIAFSRGAFQASHGPQG